MDKQINKGKGNGLTPCWITCLDYKRLSVQFSVEQETKEEGHKNSTQQPECGVSLSTSLYVCHYGIIVLMGETYAVCIYCSKAPWC